jgi:D-alanine--poly(phosphoribitol) ligase subunit 2
MSLDIVPSVHEEVVSVLTRQLKIAPESVESDLIATGMLDPLALVELVLDLETRFGVRIPLDELKPDAFRSASSIADFISQLRLA